MRAEMGIRPGWFGLLLLQNLADELIYNSKGNEVILIKRAPGGSAVAGLPAVMWPALDPFRRWCGAVDDKLLRSDLSEKQSAIDHFVAQKRKGRHWIGNCGSMRRR